ncbi:MAG: LysR substrate-binding domain-containing protein, partial [Pseudoclavibacter sp.]
AGGGGARRRSRDPYPEGMDVHRAKAFLAVAEELHFGRAAARLHIAQPPLSRLIRALESELGAVLFDRGSRRVELTAVGAALVEPARALVMQADRIPDIVRRVQRGESGYLRLGFAGASVNSIVSELTRSIRKERPGLVLDLFGSQLSHSGLDRVRSGALDAVIGRWDFLPADIDSVVLAEESLLVAVDQEHRLSGAEFAAPDELAGESWVVLPGGSGATLSNRLHVLGVRGGFVPRIVQTAVDSSSQLLLVDAGVGVALTFSGVRANIPAHAVEFLPLRPELGPVDVRLAWRRGDGSPALTAVIELAEQLAPGGADGDVS